LLARLNAGTINRCPEYITLKHLQIVTLVCAFSLSIVPVKAEDQFLLADGKTFTDIIISEPPASSTFLAADPRELNNLYLAITLAPLGEVLKRGFANGSQVRRAVIGKTP
jgi:hypothetical protein